MATITMSLKAELSAKIQQVIDEGRIEELSKKTGYEVSTIKQAKYYSAQVSERFYYTVTEIIKLMNLPESSANSQIVKPVVRTKSVSSIIKYLTERSSKVVVEVNSVFKEDSSGLCTFYIK